MSTETRDALREALAARNCKAGHPMGGDAAFSIELDMLEAEAVAALRATMAVDMVAGPALATPEPDA